MQGADISVDFHLPAIFVNLILSVFTFQGDGIKDIKERAIQLDKEPVAGRLEQHPEVGFVFRTTDGSILTPRNLRRVENTSQPPILPGTAPAHRLRLWGNESMSGAIQSYDENSIQIETITGQRLNVPVAAVQKIVHFQGDAVIFRDDFEDELTPRKTAGQPRRTEQSASGRWGLNLSEPGDRLEYSLPEPLMHGWFEVRFWDSGELSQGLEWSCEFDFESRAGSRTLQVILGSAADSYALATPHGPSLPVQRIARQRGWSRLAMRFSTERLTLLINDAVLTNRATGIGSLQAVRFVVRAAHEAGPSKLADPESGAIDDLQIAATLAAPAERQPVRDQDDLLLVNGDQFFGLINDITPRDVTIDGGFGPQRVAWSRLHEVHFKPRPGSPKLVVGQRVRLEFMATATWQSPSEFDLLEGVLRELSPDSISIEHPFLGTVRIRRDQMRTAEFLSTGGWLAIDPGFFHFGEQVNVRLQVPHPTGTDRSWQFILDELPAGAKLVLNVVDMLAIPHGSEPSKRAGATELRTFAAINDRVIEPLGLNHFLAPKYRSPARIAVPIPDGILTKGTNVLRIYQTPSNEDSRTFDDCGIFSIAIELSP